VYGSLDSTTSKEQPKLALISNGMTRKSTVSLNFFDISCSTESLPGLEQRYSVLANMDSKQTVTPSGDLVEREESTKTSTTDEA